MRVGLVTLYFPPLVRGGSHLSAYYIALGLSRQGHDVHVFTVDPLGRDDQRSSTQVWQNDNIQRHDVFSLDRPTTSLGMDITSLRMGHQLKMALKKVGLQFDVLHAYGMDTIPAVVQNRRFGHPVATVNGYWGTCPFWDHTDPTTMQPVDHCSSRHIQACVRSRSPHQSFLRHWLKWQLLANTQAFRQRYMRRLKLLMPISQNVRRILIANKFSAQNMHICYNMVDIAEYCNLESQYLHQRFDLPSDKLIFLHAGRFATYKGSRLIIEAIPQIVAFNPKAHFVFIGQGSMLPQLKQQARDMGLMNYISFGDFVNPREMPHAYHSAYALLHTATWPEPFARGPIEGMAAGTAVIGTNTGGTPEVIRDGETGLLIPPFDAKAIADASNSLLSSPEKRQALSRSGQELVKQKFSLEGQISNYEAAYRSIL